MKYSINKITKDNLDELRDIKSGTWIKYSGELITIRDASLTSLYKEYEQTGKMPLELNKKIILYAAPTQDEKITVIGPTTSKRMDKLLGFLLQAGVTATVGKGNRSEEAYNLIRKHRAPYLVLMSGVSAYLSSFFASREVIAFKELGPEAIYSLNASDLPLLLAVDTNGGSIFDRN